ncbi:MAG: WG repeat-containing protein [Ignavibacteria bacterium]|nr:WG repeat-containing protein [Ignavibacteria bacterium]
MSIVITKNILYKMRVNYKYFRFALMIVVIVIFGENLYAQPYLRYFENGKVGFIDTTGKVVIKARFAQTGDFSEGLAPARLKGLYGYIDTTGEYVIPPKYDFASSFKEGFAIVYVDSVPMYINKVGNIPFKVNYKRLNNFERGIAEVEIGENKYALINRFGNEIAGNASKIEMIDTTGIYALYNNRKGFPETMYVIDSTGKILIPEGIYESIFRFSEGFAYVSRGYDSEYNKIWGFVNREFKEVLSRKKDVVSCSLSFKEGLVDVEINNDTTNTENLKSKKNCGYMDTLGNIVIKDTTFDFCGDFENGNASVKRGDEWIKINKKGEVICDSPCEDVVFENSEGGKLIYQGKKYFFRKSKEDSSSGMYFNKIDLSVFSDSGSFIFGNFIQPKKLLFGICSKSGKILMEPIIEKYNYNESQSNCLRAVIDKKRCYVNNRGKIIWMEEDDALSDTLDIDCIYSAFTNEKRYGRTSELNFKIKKDELSVAANDNERIFSDKHLARKVYIINNSPDSIVIDEITTISCFIVCQAQRMSGEWKNIEGYILHNVWNMHTIRNGDYYEVHVPVYKGSLKTKLRYVFYYTKKILTDDGNIKFTYNNTIIGNEFYGYVNPAQLWRYAKFVGSPDKYEDFFGVY